MRAAFILLFAAVLLTGSLAGAATVAPEGVPTASAPAVTASPLCLANLSHAAKAELPVRNPAELKTATICGACSDIWCQGQTGGALCRTGKRCYNLYGNFCSQDGGAECTCYSGPLP
jgi:hypothetical protein